MKKIPQDKANLLWDAIIQYAIAEKNLECSKNPEPWVEGADRFAKKEISLWNI